VKLFKQVEFAFYTWW